MGCDLGSHLPDGAKVKAVNIRIGNRIDGWTVTEYIYAERPARADDWQPMVLLRTEIEAHLCRYMDECGNEIEEEVPTETRRVWYRADEDVEVER
jgi:hypothetical protein